MAIHLRQNLNPLRGEVMRRFLHIFLPRPVVRQHLGGGSGHVLVNVLFANLMRTYRVIVHMQGES